MMAVTQTVTAPTSEAISITIANEKAKETPGRFGHIW